MAYARPPTMLEPGTYFIPAPLYIQAMTNKQKQSTDRMAVARAGIIGNRQWRSAVTNGAYPAGINGRTAAGRRYRDLVTEYSREIAGEGGPLNPAEMALIRQAAALTVRGEALQADIVSGRAADDEAAACQYIGAHFETARTSSPAKS